MTDQSCGIETTEAPTQRAMGRTVDAASAAKTLSMGHCHSAAAKCLARLGNMRAQGARAGPKVAQEAQGLRVLGIVVCGRTSFEYQDAQVYVGSGETASNDARCRATCLQRKYIQLVEGRKLK